MPLAPNTWDAELAALLNRLSGAQLALLALLAKKREHIVQGDHAALAALAPEEQQLGAELQACHTRRQQLLEEADQAGIACRNLEEINRTLPESARRQHSPVLEESRRRAALIRHECLAQWVTIQRSVLHLSNLLEIIATRGRGEPTYGKSSATGPSGALIDQAM